MKWFVYAYLFFAVVSIPYRYKQNSIWLLKRQRSWRASIPYR